MCDMLRAVSVFDGHLWFHYFGQKWAEIIGQARQSVDFLKDQDVIKTVLNILQVCNFIQGFMRFHFGVYPCNILQECWGWGSWFVYWSLFDEAYLIYIFLFSCFFRVAWQTNTSVATSLGTYFLPQISLIFLDMLNVYRYDFNWEFGLQYSQQYFCWFILFGHWELEDLLVTFWFFFYYL